jgi:hypothetical protein
VTDQAQALERVAAELAAAKERVARIFTDWSIRGPTLEASTALAAMAQEAAGHARVCGRLAGHCPPDNLRPPQGLTTIPSSWPELIATVGTAELALGLLLDRLVASEDPPIRRQLAKMAVEERYHRRFFLGWFAELENDPSPAGALFTSARATGEADALAWLDRMRVPLVQLGMPLNAGDPDATAGGPAVGPSITEDTTCVHCDSRELAIVSEFGGSLMTSQIRCRSCGGYFERVRWRDSR